MSIEEMKLVDRAQVQLDQIGVQISNKEASMKAEAVKTALIQFKTYFANRSFSMTGSDWDVRATHGSLCFTLAVKNAQTGGIECLVLKFPEMTRRAPLSIFIEPQINDVSDHTMPVIDTSKSLLTQIQDKITLMKERLAEPPKRWQYYTAEAQVSGADKTPAASVSNKKEYLSFTRLLDIECP